MSQGGSGALRPAGCGAPGAVEAWCGRSPDGRLVLQTLFADEAVAWRRVVAGFYLDTRDAAERAGWAVVRVTVAEALRS